MSSGESQSDLEALHRSGRGKFLGLGAVIAVALGAATWSFVGKKEGIGDPELATKVLVVTHGSGGGWSAYLKEMGFEAAEGPLHGWAQKAREEVPELQEEGLAAVMKLADRFGYGFVVFESPQEVDFTALDLDELPTFDEQTRFAVVSVGDFAFPPEMTVNPAPNPALRDASVPILQALFAQTRLKSALPDAEDKSLDDIKLQDQLRIGLEHMQRVADAGTVVARIERKLNEALLGEEKATTKPEWVGHVFESGDAYPVSGAGLLSVVRPFQVITRDGITADLELADKETFMLGAADAAADARATCELGLEVPGRGSDLGVIAASDGSAFLFRARAQPWMLYTSDPSATSTCGLKPLGSLAYAPSEEIPGLVPHRSGKIARPLEVPLGAIEVATVAPWAVTTIPMPTGVWVQSVSWIDEHTLAAVAHDDNMGAKGLLLVRIDMPDKLLWIDGTLFDEGVYGGRVDDVVAVTGRASLVVAAGNPSLYRVDLPSAWADVFAAPPVIEGWKTPAKQKGSALIPVDPSKLEIVRLTQDGRADRPVVSRDGTTVTFELRGAGTEPADANYDTEIATVSIAGGAVQQLTHNKLADYEPRLTDDGRHVVFSTRLDVPRTKWRITVPRRVPTSG